MNRTTHSVVLSVALLLGATACKGEPRDSRLSFESSTTTTTAAAVASTSTSTVASTAMTKGSVVAAGGSAGFQVVSPVKERYVYASPPLSFKWWEADNLDSLGAAQWEFEKVSWRSWGSGQATAGGRYSVGAEGTTDPDDEGSAQLRLFEPRAAVCNGKSVVYYAKFGLTPKADPGPPQKLTIKDGQEKVFNNPVDCPGSARPSTVGIQTGKVAFRHPRWGDVTFVTTKEPSQGPGHLYTLDQSSNIVWDYELGGAQELLELNSPSPDRLGHIFINFNPGRYNGVIVLKPTVESYEDFRSLPPTDDYASRFYGGTAVDHNGDGVLEIDVPDECLADCTEPGPTKTYRWNGSDYV